MKDSFRERHPEAVARIKRIWRRHPTWMLHLTQGYRRYSFELYRFQTSQVQQWAKVRYLPPDMFDDADCPFAQPLTESEREWI